MSELSDLPWADLALAIAAGITAQSPDSRMMQDEEDDGLFYISGGCTPQTAGTSINIYDLSAFVRERLARSGDTGSAAPAVHRAEQDPLIGELVGALKGVLATGLNGGNNLRLAYVAASLKELSKEDHALAEASEAAVKRALDALAAAEKRGEG